MNLFRCNINYAKRPRHIYFEILRMPVCETLFISQVKVHSAYVGSKHIQEFLDEFN